MNPDSTHLTRRQGSRGGAVREGKRVCPVGTRQLGLAEPPLAVTALPPCMQKRTDERGLVRISVPLSF